MYFCDYRAHCLLYHFARLAQKIRADMRVIENKGKFQVISDRLGVVAEHLTREAAERAAGISPTNIKQTILEVRAIRLSARAGSTGDCRPLLLSCGHVAEMNFTFSYRVGDSCRCHECESSSA